MTDRGETEHEEMQRRLALELDAVLRDDELWAAIESPYGAGWSAEAMAERALRLYDFTEPLTEIRLEEFAEPFHYAIGALRDMGDACAILSRRWPEGELRDLPVDHRAEIDRGLVLLGVADWASSVGVALPLTSAPSAPVPGQGVEHGGELDGPSAEQLAASWSGLLDAFHARVADRTARRSFVQGDKFRDLAAMLIASCRMAVLAAQQTSRQDVVAVGMTQLFLAQGMFIVSWESDERPKVFPNDELLGRVLKVTGGIDWLLEHGAEVPPDLRA